MQKNSIKKIIFFGLGSAGQRHLRNLKKLEKNIIVYYYKQTKKNFVIDKNLKKNNINVIKKYNLQLVNSLNQINSIRPDLAFICNPSPSHIKFAIFCAKIGSHLFIEKPISNNFSKINNLTKIIKKKKLAVSVGYQFLFHPLIKKVKEIINDQKYGKLLYGKVIMNEDVRKYRKYGKSSDLLITRKKQGGGILLEQSHDLSSLLWIIGVEPEIIFSKMYRHKYLNFEKGVEDSAHVILSSKKGKHNCIISLLLSSFDKKKEKRLLFFFQKANLELDLIKNNLILREKTRDKVYKLKILRNKLFILQLKNFLNQSSKKKKLDRSSYNNSLLTLKTILKIKKNKLLTI